MNFNNENKVLGINFTRTDLTKLINSICELISLNKRGYACFCNVHSSVSSKSDINLLHALNAAHFCLPDGAPIAWVLSKKGAYQSRVCGPDLMLGLCAKAGNDNLPVFLYGSDNENLNNLKDSLKLRFPNLSIAGAISPPYRILTDTEKNNHIEEINSSGAKIIFVGLGCPKQEIWMYENRNKIKPFMFGVGAAFDFISGKTKRAPRIWQKIGMEWFFRLIHDPGRLWKRYLYTNTLFVYYLLLAFFSRKLSTRQ